MGLFDGLSITPRQLAEQATELGKEISEDYVRLMLREGKIAGHKVGGSWRISLQVAEEFLERWLNK